MGSIYTVDSQGSPGASEIIPRNFEEIQTFRLISVWRTLKLKVSCTRMQQNALQCILCNSESEFQTVHCIASVRPAGSCRIFTHAACLGFTLQERRFKLWNNVTSRLFKQNALINVLGQVLSNLPSNVLSNVRSNVLNNVLSSILS